MSASRGFTLIELLVAITLATIITLLGVSLMRTSINASVNNEEALLSHQAIRDMQRRIEYAWSARQPEGVSVARDGVEFTSGQKDLGSLPLRFVCRPGATNVYALWFYAVPRPTQEGQPEEAPGEMLLGDLRQCQFGFLQPPPDDKRPAQWRDDWPEAASPPEVMRLDLATLHGALPPFVFQVGGP